MRQKIFDEIKARTKETDLSVPTRQGDWWYYARTFEGKQYRVQCRCPVTDPDDWDPPVLDENTEIPGEQILLDSNAEAQGHDFFALGAALVSLDGNLLAYSVDTVGDERYTLRFKDLRTGERYPTRSPTSAAGVTWAADNRTVYYLTLDAAHRPDKVWRYRLGSGEPAELVYHEADERFWLGGRAHPQSRPTSSSPRDRPSPPRSATRTPLTRTRSSPSCCHAAKASSTRWSTRSSGARTGS